MRIFRKNAVWKAFLGVTVLLLFTMEVSAIIYGNPDPEIIIPPPKIESTGGSVSIEFCLVKGAGYFLKANSDMLLFLTKAELAEIEIKDFDTLNLNLGNAIANLELAREFYLQAVKKMEVVSFNSDKIDELLSLNYDAFQEKHHLIKPVFDEVRYYLGSGAVRELYAEILCQVDEILSAAYTIKEQVENNEFPELSSLWDIQHKCCKSMLFGQYASRVFLER